MERNKKLIKRLIEEFEKGNISEEEVLLKVNKLSVEKLDSYRLKNYWRSESLDDFIDSISYETYQNWESIDDDEALRMIAEMKNNVTNNSILKRNSQALENRYRKTTGKMYDFIFHSNLTNEEILNQLKIDDVTYL